MATEHPPLEMFIKLIKTKDARVGLRMLYRAYKTEDPVVRQAYRRLWFEIASRMEPSDVHAPYKPMSVSEVVEKIHKKERSRKKKKKKQKRKSKKERIVESNASTM